ncbi:hypothetical protein [Lysobacter silvisoli]|uniref:DUF4892 domain-containing protein n=1 Tax=Lysobacter silvisoli TaxID=2293254 RepID=A0A371JXA1_9GAMM|nr:hypothetical protein [Lysobacter silvisoli]RDZ26282.1 hypothetical protein DX914_18625 [Lysobacter silvisoli]
MNLFRTNSAAGKRAAGALLIAVTAAAAATVWAYTRPAEQIQLEPVRQGADIPSDGRQRKLQRATAKSAPLALAAAAVSDDDVGDADSFGRNLRWLGLTDMLVELGDSCPGSDPEAGCQVLNPAPAFTGFAFEDLGRITLPGKSTHSLLCYWFSPVLTVRYANPTASQAIARLRLSPTLTVENPVLATPGLIDPTTGVPFGGKLITGMTSSELFEVPLAPGVAFTERTRDSAVCIAGFVNRKALAETYGLSEAQIKEFFKKPTTVRLNISGSAQYVESAQLYFGLRIIGD